MFNSYCYWEKGTRTNEWITLIDILVFYVSRFIWMRVLN